MTSAVAATMPTVPLPPLVPRPVLGSVEELLADATDRVPFAHTDGKSSAAFERVVIDGRPHVVKHVDTAEDWTLRFFHATTCIPAVVWELGLMDVLPERIDHGVVAVAAGLGERGLGAALLLRDLSDELVPEGDAPLAIEEHHQLLDDMAALTARMWGWPGHDRLIRPEDRYRAFGAAEIEGERRRGFPDRVPEIAAEGWERFASAVPAEVHLVVDSLRHEARPLAEALAETPSTFLHGDWKLGNTGHGRDGRTILIDWTYCGAGPACADLGWYLSLNRARMPESKEAAIERFRSSLERHGVSTEGWWDRQLGLCLLGSLVGFGWEKAFGDPAELGWWCDRAREGAALL